MDEYRLYCVRKDVVTPEGQFDNIITALAYVALLKLLSAPRLDRKDPSLIVRASGRT